MVLLFLGLLLLPCCINGESITCQCPHCTFDAWSKCSVSCGGGTQSQVGRRCRHWPYTDCYRYRDCNTFCYHGGTYFNGTCACTDEYYGICCEPECPFIANCLRKKCNYGALDNVCLRCTDVDLYKLDDKDRKCSRKCSYDNRWCWPGTCSGEYDITCVCATGFTRKYDSSQVTCHPTAKPELDTCTMRAIAFSKDYRQSAIPLGRTTHCENQLDFYGNFQVEKLQTDILYEYKVNIPQLNLTRPAYVESESFGITDAQIEILSITISGVESIVSKTIQKQDPSSSNPEHMLSKENIVLPNTALLHDGYSLCLRFNATGGGHLTSKNVQTHSTWQAAYDKTFQTKTLCYRYDVRQPQHCLETTSCVFEPVHLSDRITRHRNVTVSFSGWFDPIPTGGHSVQSSGIESYEITIHAVKKSTPGRLAMDSASYPGTTSIKQSSNASLTLQLPDQNPALFAILLTVKDVANNVRQARRFVLYDAVSDIEVASNEKLYCTSAVQSTNYTWQTHYNNICFSWVKRYHNDKYVMSNLLDPVDGDHHGHISGIYEQNTGLLPVSGTVNVNGIVEFKYSLSKQTISFSQEQMVSVNESIFNVTAQTICVNPTLKDGETYRFLLHMTDIVGNHFQERLFVQIDTSEPSIENIWLVRDRHKQLFVHNTTDLSKMELQFNALDPHSGLHSIQWKFLQKDSGGLLGSGSVGIQRILKGESCSSTLSCYCPHVGACENFNYSISLNSLVTNSTHIADHNRDYFYKLTVINNAHLITKLTFDILVDDSPPEIGIIFDGSEDGPDIDFTSQNTIMANWHGFIDHESGIRLYRVALGPRCVSKHQMHLNDSLYSNYSFLETVDRYGIFSFNEPMKYYVSVIAYNNAMEPSNVVCSDGFTFDLTPPMLNNVTLLNAKSSMYTACSNGTAWLITDNATRININIHEACHNSCIGFGVNNFVEAMPEQFLKNRTLLMLEKCLIPKQPVIYLPTDTIDLRWTTSDHESQIHAIEVGFGSTETLPDLVGFHTTKLTNSYRERHSGLSNGDRVYIFPKVINKASLESTVTYGPVIIDETEPVCKPNTQVQVNTTHITVTWAEDTFTDPEQVEDIDNIEYRMTYTSDNRTTVSTVFQNIYDRTHNLCYKRNCLVIAINEAKELEADGSNPLVMYFKAENIVKRICFTNTDPFQLPPKNPPSPGIVKDCTFESCEEDIDYILNTDTHCLSWKGFVHHFSHIYFEVGIGSCQDCLDDVMPFERVNSTVGFCRDSAMLLHDTKYFGIVRASNAAGATIVRSDGFIKVNVNKTLSSMHVYDDIGCKLNPLFESVVFSSSQHASQTHKPMQIGHMYTAVLIKTMYLDLNEDAIVVDTFWDSHSAFISFFALKLFPVFSLNVSHASLVNVTILDCIQDIDFTMYNSHVSANWDIEHNLRTVSSFQVTLWQNYSGFANLVESKNVEKLFHTTFSRTTLRDGHYYTTVQPCFSTMCLPYVSSNGFYVHNNDTGSKIEDMRATVIDSENCAAEIFLKLEFHDYKTDDKIDPIRMYRWAVTMDEDAHKMASDWEPYIPDSSCRVSHQCNVSKCWSLKSFQHDPRFVCLQRISASGLVSISCTFLRTESGPDIFDKQTVYDIDAGNPDLQYIWEGIHSANMGNLMTDLRKHELNYCSLNTRVGAVVVGLGERQVTWYIMVRPFAPIVSCDKDINCLLTMQTSGGFVKLPMYFTLPERKLYICAMSNSGEVKLEKDIEYVTSFRGCSNGITVDDSPPMKGFVEILANDGFLSHMNIITVHWYGFVDKHNQYGNGSEIAFYQYALGSQPGSEDILQFKTVGLSQHEVTDILNLQNGQNMYATVICTDNVGLIVSAYSDRVTYEYTPPSEGWIHVGHPNYHLSYLSCDDVNVHWGGFSDLESGIMMYEIGFGSTSFSVDVVQYHRQNGYMYHLHINDQFNEGYRYHAFIKVTNVAGMSVVAVSDSFLIDCSPPVAGIVRDGQISKLDIDYQDDILMVKGHWLGFTDSHTGIMYYMAGVGTKHGKSDVVEMSYLGLRTGFAWNTSLTEGQQCFISVSACNFVNMCTFVSSDGVIVDASPPLRGLVHVGLSGKHDHYIGQSSLIEVSWFDIHDPHSGLAYLELCIGSDVDSPCGILPRENMHLHSSVIRTNLSMPINKSMFVTIRAFNRAGLYSDSTSDMFVIDDTPPIIGKRPFLDTSFRSLNNNSQFDPSVVVLKWHIYDIESPIVKQSLSVKSHKEGHTNVEEIEVESLNEFTINLSPKQRLMNGDNYTVTITVCNAAGHCSVSESDTILVDSSPPQIGSLHNPLSWYITNSVWYLNLTWSGFVDAESEIDKYYVSISNTYSGHEFMDHVAEFHHEGDRYALQRQLVSLRIHPVIGKKIIVSVYAQTYVGLRSDISRNTVRILSTSSNMTHGLLEIERHSCYVHFCNNDCTCSVVGGKCLSISQLTCKEIYNTTNYDTVDVVIGSKEHTTYSASSSCISAKWTIQKGIFGNSMSIQRFEWSMGIKGMPFGDGIFDILHEKVWYDVGLQSYVVHCLQNTRELLHDHEYVVYIKAWYTDTEYSVYVSLPVIIDRTAPSIRRGKHVTVSDETCIPSVRYSIDLTTITSCWKSVFVDLQSGISKYLISIGTSSGVADIAVLKDIGLSTNHTWDNLTLHAGTTYFISVIAVNRVGLQSKAASAILTVDFEKPMAGQIFTTRHFRNSLAHSENASFGLSWNGFQDCDSGIYEYEIALFELNINTNTILKFQSAGMKNWFIFSNTSLRHGKQYIAAVRAVDTAGHKSNTVVSEPVLIDVTVPTGYICNNYETRETYSVFVNISTFVHSVQVLTRATEYQLTIESNSSAGDMELILTINEYSRYIPVTSSRNGTLIFTYSFYIYQPTFSNIRIASSQVYNYTGYVSFELIECTNLSTVEPIQHRLNVQQIDYNRLDIHMRVIDLESGIKSVQLGLGTNKGGFQLISLTEMSLDNYHSVNVNVHHNTEVYATAIVENYSGLRSFFTSDPVTIDHTSPILDDVVTTLEYTGISGNESITLALEWRATDQESSIKICWFKAGNIKGTEDIVNRTSVPNTGHYTVPLTNVLHGAHIHVQLECMNNAGLISGTYAPTINVIRERPYVGQSVLHVIKPSKQGLVGDTIFTTDENITLFWDTFTYNGEHLEYEVQYTLQNSSVVIKSLYFRNYCYLDDIQSGGNYSIRVRGVNARGQTSDVISTRVLVDDSEPRLTGSLCNVTRDFINTLFINCKDVFYNNDEIPFHQYLTVGSDVGLQDIATIENTDMVTLTLHTELHQVYIVLKMVYSNGRETAYRGLIDVN